MFKRRTWNSNNLSKKVVWQCKTYVNEGRVACDAKSVDEQVLHAAFVRVFNRMYENKERFMKTLKANIVSVLSSRVGQETLLEIEGQMQQLKSDLEELVNLKLSISFKILYSVSISLRMIFPLPSPKAALVS
ncbi:hypothetical protein P4H61_00305 [Paenibacillus peoriae]|uniref:recombinase zinc beta ribbon domain-containing protein n=1 Tax=Paenibacillus peoriae TaxID=59893 RepID=UPI001F515E66|nr:recombinase zinc beta ribbon domain-containing protein [Paenibacillus peoriae]MEC0179942.1 hypothetical protein [Paenibacillus peoriae]